MFGVPPRALLAAAAVVALALVTSCSTSTDRAEAPVATAAPVTVPEPTTEPEPTVQPAEAAEAAPALGAALPLEPEAFTGAQRGNVDVFHLAQAIQQELRAFAGDHQPGFALPSGGEIVERYSPELDRTFRVLVGATGDVENYSLIEGDALGLFGADFEPFTPSTRSYDFSFGEVTYWPEFSLDVDGDETPGQRSEAELLVARNAIDVFGDAVAPPAVAAFAPGAASALDAAGPLAGKRVGLIANPASVVDGVSTIDLFAASGAVELVALFAPEHGVRGDLGAGEPVPGGVDPTTGVVVHSLYGGTRAPTEAMLADLDVLVYDLQDVGTRFYTFISTMGLAMQAASAAEVPFVVLDRPNPQTSHPSGYVRKPGYESFIGQYPIPAVYGLTSGELAQAIVGERWLDGLDDLELAVVPMTGWSRGMSWGELGIPWVPPSPGLPTAEAAAAYPGTVLFEATTVSYGRGTDHVFRQIGAPWIDADALAARLNALGQVGVVFEPVQFTPVRGDLATAPAYEGTEAHGVRWVVTDPTSFEPVVAGVAALQAVVEMGAAEGIPVIDRPDFLDLLTGTNGLRIGLESGWSLEAHVRSWASDARAFRAAMQPYVLYPG